MTTPLTDERRVALSSLITNWFSTLDADGRLIFEFDYFDASKIDELIDQAIAPTIADAVECARAASSAAGAELPPFPTMLRKMWSGGDVQGWIDQNIAPLVRDAVPPAAGVPPHVRFTMESTARWLEGGCDPLAAAKEIRACLAKLDAAPAAPVAEAEPYFSGVSELIIRDVCEMEPANPDLSDTICIDVSDLQAIVKRHTESPEAQAVAADGAACKGKNCGATDGVSHSPECVAEHEAAVSGAVAADEVVLDTSVLARLSAQIMGCPINPALSKFARAVEANVRAAVSPATADKNGWASFETWFERAWLLNPDKDFSDRIRCKAWAWKMWKHLRGPATAESKCTRCGSSTAQACNERGCFYLESGEGEPATADERAAFEAKFKVPSQCVRSGSGYAATGYNAWDAHKFIARWEGWQARASQAAAPQANAADERAAQDDLLQLDVLLANFHAAVWHAGAGDDGPVDYDMAGKDEAKEIQRHVRAMLAERAAVSPATAGWMLVPKHRGTKPLAELIIAASLACVENRLLDDDTRHELAQFADQLQHAPQSPAQAAAPSGESEDAYVIRRLSEALADISVTLRGDDAQREDDPVNPIEKAKRAAQVLRLEVELHRAQAAAPAEAREPIYQSRLLKAPAWTDVSRTEFEACAAKPDQFEVRTLSRVPADAGEAVAPSGYAYRYPAGDSTVIRFNNGEEVNGSRPLEAVPYWLGAQGGKGGDRG